MDSVSFNTFNFSTMASMMGKSEIIPHASKDGEFDPSKLFKKKNVEDESPVGFHPDNTIQYDPKDVQELEDYCKLRGIIGVNFGKMSPRAVLNMLKNKNGFPSEGVSSTKQILFD